MKHILLKISPKNKFKTFSTIKYLSFVVLFMLSACSTKNNKFINRTYHKTTTTFNVLFNGKYSLDKAENVIVDNYIDNFNEVLPITPFRTGMDAMAATSYLKQASEKASKAIQKHSMFIADKERNKRMDEAYMLLGKTKFYQTKYFPALEAFNYVKINFSAGKQYYNAKLWSVKTNLKLENSIQAIDEIKKMLKNKNLPEDLKPELNAHYSDAYLQQKKYDLSIKYMKRAISKEKDKRIKTRYSYILGQLYRLNDDLVNSTKTFELIEQNGTPYEYAVNARLEKAENFNPEINNLNKYIVALDEMLEQKKNIKFKGKIYYQKGSVYYKSKKYNDAVVNFNSAIKHSERDFYYKGISFEKLGNLNFDIAKYLNAANYYDSTLAVMPNTYINYKPIRRKRNQLDDVIKFLKIAEANDSVLKIYNMNDEDRIAFFENHVKLLKADDEAKKEQERIAMEEAMYNEESSTLIVGKKSKFYFYNSVTLEKGRAEFSKIWGDRPLQDQWRILNSATEELVSDEELNQEDSENNSENIAVSDSIKNATADAKYNIELYISKIPTNTDTINKLVYDRNYSYYVLGLIYNEQFGKYKLSAETLEELLSFEPEEDLKLPTYYYLYKNYSELNDDVNKQKYKNIIINDYSGSRYANIILNPGKLNLGDKEKIVIRYEEAIKLYKNEEYREALLLSEILLKDYSTGELIPRIELMKSTLLGRLKARDDYEKSLKYIIFNYPNNEVSDKAKVLLKESKEKRNVKYESYNKEYPRIVIIADSVQDFSKLLKRTEYRVWQKRLKVEVSQYSIDKDVFVVYNFDKWETAEAFKEELFTTKVVAKDLGNKKYDTFIISRFNFDILQRSKNTEEYKKILDQ
ncbi:MAG: hypothetical protein KAG96_01140 [Ichthyobacteriaceae bacterium]|nr:hypothetical protein [Ichthyobacteriaceae bacterium]